MVRKALNFSKFFDNLKLKFQRIFALNLLLVGIAVAGVIEAGHHSNVHYEGSLYDFRSPPGVVQPEFQNRVSYDDTAAFFKEDEYVPEYEGSKSEFLLPPAAPEISPLPEYQYEKYPIKHEDYGLPEIKHDEYGVPEIKHEEYGPPVERIQAAVTTEQ